MENMRDGKEGWRRMQKELELKKSLVNRRVHLKIKFYERNGEERSKREKELMSVYLIQNLFRV